MERLRVFVANSDLRLSSLNIWGSKRVRIPQGIVWLERQLQYRVDSGITTTKGLFDNPNEHIKPK
jgi:hypothetical protein